MRRGRRLTIGRCIFCITGVTCIPPRVSSLNQSVSTNAHCEIYVGVSCLLLLFLMCPLVGRHLMNCLYWRTNDIFLFACCRHFRRWSDLYLAMYAVVRVLNCYNLKPGDRLRLKYDGTRAETRFRLSAKRTSPIKSAGASGRLTTGSRGVRIIGSNAGYTMFWGSVKSTDYPLHSPVPPSLSVPCVTVCHQVSTGLYVPPVVPLHTVFFMSLLFLTDNKLFP